MLLLTVEEWIGPTRDAKNPMPERTRLRGWVTCHALPSAIMTLRAYEDGFNARRRHAGIAINMRLLCVAQIDDLSPVEIAAARLELIENTEELYRAEEA